MLRNYLAGFEPKQPQIVGNMAVIPLVNSEIEFTGIAGAENVQFKQDRNYSVLEFAPAEDGLTIIPNGYTIITKEAAQDRTVPAVNLISKKKKVQAYCVQSSQSGHINPNNKDKQTIRLLPLSIRHHAHTIYKNNPDLGALWIKLREMNRKLGVHGDYLVTFFQRFKDELDQFVAQFEPVPGQRGAIVLINGRVVGMDIMPSAGGFLNIWEQLIRDCYGSEAIRQQGEATPEPPAILKNVDSLDKLLDAVKEMAKAEQDWAYGIVKAVLDREEELQQESIVKTETFGDLAIKTILTEELEGQGIINRDGMAVYLSLFRYAVPKTKVKAFSI